MLASLASERCSTSSLLQHAKVLTAGNSDTRINESRAAQARSINRLKVTGLDEVSDSLSGYG